MTFSDTAFVLDRSDSGISSIYDINDASPYTVHVRRWKIRMVELIKLANRTKCGL